MVFDLCLLIFTLYFIKKKNKLYLLQHIVKCVRQKYIKYTEKKIYIHVKITSNKYVVSRYIYIYLTYIYLLAEHSVDIIRVIGLYIQGTTTNIFLIHSNG